jgi:hypothetical protein
MCTNNCVDIIQNWHVSEEVQGSDHLLVSFEITISTIVFKRNYEKGDWNLFQKDFEQFNAYEPDEWTTKHLDMETECFCGQLEATLNKNFPMEPIRMGI